MKEIKITECRRGNPVLRCSRCRGDWHKVVRLPSEWDDKRIAFVIDGLHGLAGQDKRCAPFIIDITYLLREVPEFKVGDRVEIIDSQSPFNSALGQICAISNGRYEVGLDVDMGSMSVVDKRGVWASPDALRKIDAPQFKVGDKVRVKKDLPKGFIGAGEYVTVVKTDTGMDNWKVLVKFEDTFVAARWGGTAYRPDQLEKVEEFQSADFDMCFIDQPPENDADKMRVLLNSLPSWMPKEAKSMKQVRVTECTEGACPHRDSCLNRWHPVEMKENGDWKTQTYGKGGYCVAAPLSQIRSGYYIQKYDIRDAPDSTLDREEVSEVENQIGLYHVVAWEVDPEENRIAMAYHDWVVAKNKGNAQVKAIKSNDWKGTDDPDDYVWTIALVS